MKKNLWRLGLALVISASGFLGSVLWFNAGKTDAQHGDKKPMARLNSASNEVQRKPLQRVIWESVNKNDELYPGEAVRTSPNAQAQLYFMKTGTTVNLDPDSLIVLEENDKGLSLDFLQGNVFVQSSQDAGKQTEALTLKTGNGEIKLKSADMSLSKNKNGNVDLEVHRGEAELKQGSKKTALNREKSAELTENGVSVATDRVQLTQPQAGSTLYLNLAKGEKLDLGWKPLPQSYNVNIEVGRLRSELQKVAGIQATGPSGQMSLTSKPGKWYLRLTATSTDPKLPPISSAVIPFMIEPKSPPSLIEPRQEASVLKTGPDAPTSFKWLSRHKFISQVLEVALDPQFKNIKHKENLAGDLTGFSTPLADGKYYWRVTGFLKFKDKTESLSSPASQFSLISKWDIKPPTLTSPVNQQHLAFSDAQKTGVTLKWQVAQGVDTYKYELQQKVGDTWKTVKEQETETLAVKLSDFKPGTYQWRVSSLDPKGGEAKASSTQQFIIEEMPKLEWAEPNGTVDYQFTTPTPSLKGQWKPLVPGPAQYRFKIANSDQGIDNADWQSTKQTVFDVSVANEGLYQVQVEALGAKGQVLAQSDVKEFEVKRLPLLAAPKWAENTPDIIKGDGKGNLSVSWNQVEGAQKYLMVLESSDGKVVDSHEVSRNIASFTKLKPGEYQVKVQSIDGLRRPGPASEIRKVQVPEKSDIRAPKIKAMKVK